MAEQLFSKDLGVEIRPPFKNLFTLREVLPVAEVGGYALGAFSPRSTVMIRPVLRAGQKAQSPLIVQISQKELQRHAVTPAEFAGEFFAALQGENITIPVVLHLDHTWDFSLIQESIAAGFTSVMIDASDRRLEENIATVKKVVNYAHSRNVSVEAELGRIGTTDFAETAEDVEQYTRPEEAQRFAAETGVDALAVSVGTAHGVYLVRQPKIDYERLMAIRRLTPVAMVIHGGSGIPADMLKKAFSLPGGGPSKVNIATDLELAMLQALGRKDHMRDAELKALPGEEKATAQAAIEATVLEKIHTYLGSAGKAKDFFALMK